MTCTSRRTGVLVLLAAAILVACGSLSGLDDYSVSEGTASNATRPADTLAQLPPASPPAPPAQAPGPPAATSKPCALPWGESLDDGKDVTAFAAASVPAGATCASETRHCSNGELSGTFTQKACTPTDPCPSGKVVGGACWYFGELAQSCTTVCAAHAGTYDAATATFAGSGGTNANCESVLTALGVAPGTFSYDAGCSYGAVGCTTRESPGGHIWRRCGNGTTAAATDSATRRACACAVSGL